MHCAGTWVHCYGTELYIRTAFMGDRSMSANGFKYRCKRPCYCVITAYNVLASHVLFFLVRQTRFARRYNLPAQYKIGYASCGFTSTEVTRIT